ncbi:hypothetical protein AB0B45_39420 [Nonomuraea sp. NPDC049152]|uniref:hypothetical protein n=1 Tax=Nonomuraea sp. NPDC049152 TaxID=3154350 RepID=UPI0033F0DAC0
MPYTPDHDHRRPEGASDAIVEGLGRLSEALETIERARGHLYAFHQLTGTADLTLDEVVELLESAGQGELARRISTELLGREVIPGHWTFQIVEEYDDGYYQTFKELEHQARVELLDGRRHVYEAEMRQRRQT